MGEAFISRRGGGYNVGDELLPSEYSLSLIRRFIDYPFSFMDADNSYIYLLENNAKISKLNISDLAVALQSSSDYYCKYVLFDSSYIYIGAYSRFYKINKSDLTTNLSYTLGTFHNIVAMGLGSSSINAVIGIKDTTYAFNSEWSHIVEYYYSGTWKSYIIQYDVPSSTDISAVCADSTYVYVFWDYDLYKIQASNNTLVATYSRPYRALSVVRVGSYLYVRESSYLTKYDTNNTQIARISYNGSFLYNDGTYLYYQSGGVVSQIDYNLNIKWSKAFNSSYLKTVCRYGSNFFHLEKLSSNLSKIDIYNTGTNIPEEKITIIA